MIQINGQGVSVDSLPLQTTLLDLLRERGLTGAKEGCAEGECGACTVVMVADHNGGSIYRAVNSCLMFVPGAIGREFYTVEALAKDGELVEAQTAMAAAGGSQCGYCTPGFVMSLFAEQYRPGRDGPCDVRALSGNLCRCTGYRPIRDAALSLAAPADGRFLARLQAEAAPLASVTCRRHDARFDRPATLRECVALAAEYPGAKWISGATDMAVESNLRFRRWPHLIALDALPELRTFDDTPERVVIGAGLPLAEIEQRWTDAPEAVRRWLPLFASPPIRNRATLGGSLGTASPIGDAAPILMSLNASLHLSGAKGNRVVPLASFFTGFRQTVLATGELIRAIEIPKPFPQLASFYKVSKRRADDISTVAAGFSLSVDPAGRISQARFALGGVAAVPLRVSSAEHIAIGETWNAQTAERVGNELQRVLLPIGDHRGSSAYRLAMAKSLVEKFYWESKR